MTAIGALIGLALAIILITKKVPVAYSLIGGALVGGLLGGLGLEVTIKTMIQGVNDINPAILRVLSAGVLTGVLVVTGAAESISINIIKWFGRKNLALSLAISTMILTAVGVFIDVAVITVSPIALSMCRRYKQSPIFLLLMMVGGGKAGNIISPNPNTIVAAENFGAPLSTVMAVNIGAAVVGVIFTVWVVGKVFNKLHSKAVAKSAEDFTLDAEEKVEDSMLPAFWRSIAGPVIAILLLALRPLFGIVVDPLVALPVGGLVGLLLLGNVKKLLPALNYGVGKMVPVAVLLIGTGTIAGIIQASTIKDLLISLLEQSPAAEHWMATISGALMSGATASTTAGASLASSSFASTILTTGVTAVWGAAMINSAATMLDHLPHGSFFHATSGAMGASFKQALLLIPYESAIGTVLAVGTVATYYIASLL